MAKKKQAPKSPKKKISLQKALYKIRKARAEHDDYLARRGELYLKEHLINARSHLESLGVLPQGSGERLRVYF